MSSGTGRQIRTTWNPKIYYESTKTVGRGGQVGSGVPSQDKAQGHLSAPSADSTGDLAGLAIPGSEALHGFRVLFHLTKDHRLTLQPLGLGSADDKLGTICVGPSIGHGPDARTRAPQDEISIIKLLPLCGLAPRIFMVCDVTALAQKSPNPSGKPGAKPFLQVSEHASLLLSWELCLRTAGRRCRPAVQDYGGVDPG